jgi:hypothetical protein
VVILEVTDNICMWSLQLAGAVLRLIGRPPLLDCWGQVGRAGQGQGGARWMGWGRGLVGGDVLWTVQRLCDLSRTTCVNLE